MPTVLQRRHAGGNRSSVGVTVALIHNTLQEDARGGPTQLSDTVVPLGVGGSLSMVVELGSQDVATVRLRRPSGTDGSDSGAPL